MKNLRITFRELAYIMDIPVEESKQLFHIVTGENEVSSKLTIEVDKLKGAFGNTRSHDSCYDGKNELLFNLEMKKTNYRKHLNDKSIIKKIAFGGGKTIFTKILSQEQLAHAYEQLEMKHKHLFGIKSCATVLEILNR